MTILLVLCFRIVFRKVLIPVLFNVMYWLWCDIIKFLSVINVIMTDNNFKDYIKLTMSFFETIFYKNCLPLQIKYPVGSLKHSNYFKRPSTISFLNLENSRIVLAWKQVKSRSVCLKNLPWNNLSWLWDVALYCLRLTIFRNWELDTYPD